MTRPRMLALIGAGAIVAVAIAVVVLVHTRHTGTGTGKAGPNELFTAVLEAASRGDQTALLALNVSAGAARVTTCGPNTGAPDDAPHGRYSSDPDEMKAYEEKQLGKQLSFWKDRSATLTSLQEHGEPETMPATPADSHARCKSTAAVAVHNYDATLTMKDGDHTRTGHALVAAAEIDGGWYFFDLPAPPTTAAALAQLRDRMCTCASQPSPATCADKIQRGVDQWMRGVTDPDLLEIQAAITDCRRKAAP